MEAKDVSGFKRKDVGELRCPYCGVSLTKFELEYFCPNCGVVASRRLSDTEKKRGKKDISYVG